MATGRVGMQNERAVSRFRWFLFGRGAEQQARPQAPDPWSRPQGKARGVIILIGASDATRDAFAAVARAFLAEGLIVWAVDLGSRASSVSSKLSENIGRISAAVTFARSQEPDLPIYLFGQRDAGELVRWRVW